MSRKLRVSYSYTAFHIKLPFLELDYTASAKCRNQHFAPLNGQSRSKKGTFDEKRYIKEALAMLAELRQNTQITIPKEIIARLGLHEGDKLEVTEQDNLSYAAVVYPKKYFDELR
jgi:AbrB family looped-hinge helix DNA binding protein